MCTWAVGPGPVFHAIHAWMRAVTRACCIVVRDDVSFCVHAQTCKAPDKGAYAVQVWVWRELTSAKSVHLACGIIVGRLGAAPHPTPGARISRMCYVHSCCGSRPRMPCIVLPPNGAEARVSKFAVLADNLIWVGIPRHLRTPGWGMGLAQQQPAHMSPSLRPACAGHVAPRTPCGSASGVTWTRTCYMWGPKGMT